MLVEKNANLLYSAKISQKTSFCYKAQEMFYAYSYNTPTNGV